MSVEVRYLFKEPQAVERTGDLLVGVDEPEEDSRVPQHVLVLADAFADAGDHESACLILDGYERYGEAYIVGLYDFIADQNGLSTPSFFDLQPSLFDQSPQNNAA